MLLCEFRTLDTLNLLPVFELGTGGAWFPIYGISLLSSCYAKSKQLDQGYICLFTVQQSTMNQMIGLSLLYSNVVVFDKTKNRIGRNR